MNTKRISLVVTLLVLLSITACDIILPVEILPPEEPIPPSKESLPAVSEPIDEGASLPDSESAPGSIPQAVITRENAPGLTQVEYLGKGNINNIAWSPTGSPIALATNSGIYLIDLQTYEEMHFSEPASGDIAFSTDGTLLASAEASRVILRDLETGSERLVLEGHADQVYHIAFSPVENLLAAASAEGRVNLWDLASGEVLSTLEKPGTSIYGLAFSPDGQILSSNLYSQDSDKSTVGLWDVDSGTEIITASKISGTTLAVSPMGEMIAAGGYDDPLMLYDFDGQVLITLDEELKPVRDLAFSPDGKILVSATSMPQEWRNTTVRLWDTTNGELLSTLDAEDGYNHQLSFSPDGTQIATAALDKVKLWDVASGQEIATITDQPDEKGGYGIGGVIDFAWSPDGNTLALANFTGVTLVNRHTLQEIQLSADESQPQIGHIITFSPNGKMLAVSLGKEVNVYDVESQELLITLNEFEEGMMAYGIAFSPDNTTLAIGWGNPWGSGSGSVKIWELSTGAVIHEFGYDDRETIYNLTFNPEGDLLAAISGIGQVHLWNVPEETEEMTLTGTSGYGFAVAFSPDGKLLAAGGGASDGRSYDYDEAELRLFDLKTGELVHQLEGHQAIIRSLSFNSSGDVLASASWDGTVRLWDTQTGQQLAVLDVPGATSVGFSPDGTLLATAGDSDVLRLWGTPETNQGETPPIASEKSDEEEPALAPDTPHPLASQTIITRANVSSLTQVGILDEKGIAEIAWVSDGSSIATFNDRGEISILNAQTLTEEQRFLSPSDLFQRLAINSKGNWVGIIVDEFRKVEIWDITDNKLHMTLGDDEEFDNVYIVSFSPDGNTIATGHWGEKCPIVMMWDLTTGKLLEKIEISDVECAWDRPIHRFAFCPDGKCLAVFACDGSVYFHHDDAWSLHLYDDGGYTTGSALAVSPNGDLLAIGKGSFGKNLSIIDLSTTWPEPIFELEEPKGVVSDVSFNADDTLIAAIVNGSVNIWDIKTGKHLIELDIYPASAVSFSPDGTLLATAGGMFGLRLWGTPETAASFEENLASETSTIPALALGEDFSPGRWSQDGRYYYYTQQGPMDEPGPDQATNTLTFLDTHTGETCASMVEIWTYAYNEWVEAKVPTGRNLDNRAFWMNDNRLLYLSLDGSLLAITPCSDSIDNWTYDLPETILSFDYGAKNDQSQTILIGASSPWLFTPSTRKFVKIAIPAANAYGETWFSWSPWEAKLISSRLEEREDGFGIVVEDIDLTNGAASLILDLPLEQTDLLPENQWVSVNWLAKDVLSLGYWLDDIAKDYTKDYVIDLSDQPYTMIDVYSDLFGVEDLSTENLSHWGYIGEMGGDAYYFVVCEGLSPDGQCYLYSAETELVETYSFDPPKLLIFPNGEIAFADSFGEQPMGEDPYQVIHIGADREPYDLEISGQIPGQTPWAKVVMIPGRDQVLMATDQGISLVDLETGETLRFWVLENQGQYNDFSLDISPDGKQLIVYPHQDFRQTAVYWLDLEN